MALSSVVSKTCHDEIDVSKSVTLVLERFEGGDLSVSESLLSDERARRRSKSPNGSALRPHLGHS